MEHRVHGERLWTSRFQRLRTKSRPGGGVVAGRRMEGFMKVGGCFRESRGVERTTQAFRWVREDGTPRSRRC